jgi:hypothetical protein
MPINISNLPSRAQKKKKKKLQIWWPKITNSNASYHTFGLAGCEFATQLCEFGLFICKLK